MNRIIILLILSVFGVLYWFYRPSYGYFRNPLDRSLQLAANFGELREGHFHMGVDISTGGMEGLPVYAAADGYISHLSMQENGLGKALFVTHPNGLITVYGHLQHFVDSIEALASRRQYAQQSWQQEIDLPALCYPVQKGDLIAYSGNTGSSQAPHLHFEVRDAKTGANINPQLEGFRIDDEVAPVINNLYWYDRRYSTYMTRAQKINVTGREGHYQTRPEIIRINSPLISLGISATDKSSASSHVSGIFGASLWLDDSLIHAFSLRGLPPADTRYINACIDYSKWQRSGIYVQHLSTLPGNHAPIFTAGRDGLIHLQDTFVHVLRIRVCDVQDNSSELTFRIRYVPFHSAKTYEPVLFHTTAFSFGRRFSSGAFASLPGKETRIEGASFMARFSPNAFYDRLTFHWQELPDTDARRASALIYLHDPAVPVHDHYFVQVRTTLPNGDPLRSHTVMQLMSGDSPYIVKGSWQGDWMNGSFNRLGILHLIVDTMTPEIHSYQWEEGQHFGRQASDLRVQCGDDLGVIAGFRGEIDGHWVPFTQKGNIYTYSFDDHCTPGKHTLSLTAMDVAGNKVERRMDFVRD